MKRVLLLLLFTSLLLANDIVNPGFEAGKSGWDLWSRASSIDTSQGFGRSRNSLKVHSDKKEWVGASQEIKVPRDAQFFEIEGRVKTEGVQIGEKSWEWAQINIEYLDKKKKNISYPGQVCLVKGDTDWKLYHQRYMLPEEVVYIKVVLALGNASGTVWFDDITAGFKSEKYQKVDAKKDGPLDYGKWYAVDTSGITMSSHVVDWSHLLHKPAGKYGFAQKKNGKLIFENGKEAKFYGTVLIAGDIFKPKAQVDSLVARLAKMGCNTLRLHLMDTEWAEPNIFAEKSSTRKLGASQLERMDYLIYACKQQGIYTFLDFCAAREFYVADGVKEQAPSYGAKQNGFFSRKLIDLQKEFIAQLMSHTNKYTGVTYADEPAIALAELINETNIYSQFGENLITGAYAEELQARWNAEGHRGKVPFFTNDYDLTPARLKLTTGSDFKEAVQFYKKIEDDYFTEMMQFCKDSLKLKMPITGSNMPERILSLVASTEPLDYAANDAYWDHPRMWELSNGWDGRYMAPVDNKSQLQHAKESTVPQLSYFKNKQQPFIAWGDQTFPNEYQMEGNAFITLYGALQGWSGLMQHCINYNNVGQAKLDMFMYNLQPDDMALWSVMAPLFLRGDLKEASGEIVEPIAESEFYTNGNYTDFLDSNWQVPFITKYSKQYGAKKVKKPSVANLSQYIKGAVITSETDELTFDTKKGVVTVNAPRVQGVMGHIKNRMVQLPAFEVQVKNPFGAVFAISADETPLDRCERFYLAVVTPTKMTGTQYNSARTGLVKEGTLPVLCQVMEGEMVLKLQGKWQMAPIKFSGDRLAAKKVPTLIDLSKGRTYLYEVTKL